ncbi:hypothetical protein BKA61DRAFT_614827 [Leptodontidium sp. MPI-SDFR-AT-0119]|nr:hypothetical protein BKA61DRAFT_614827 [Leptodontidium sp. MPI-SDFR-AT-0119]
MWHSELANADMLKSSNIQGIEELAALYLFPMDVCPPYSFLPRWIARHTIKQQEESKKEVEASLKYLDRWGYWVKIKGG